jgi:hypothetical protein
MPRGRGAKVKKIMPKGSSEDADVLNSMFDQMTGAQNADPEVIIPKLVAMHSSLAKFSKIYNLLLNFNDFTESFPEYEDKFAEIREFLAKVQIIIDEKELIDDEKLKQTSSEIVNTLYKKLKEQPEIQSIVITSGNLGQYQRHLVDKTNLSDMFIKRESGLSLAPLNFTGLDLKALWSSDKLTNMAKKYILTVLSHTYIIGHEIYELLTSPDIDIKKFSTVLIASIGKMRKQIPRCDKAFDIIQNSVNLLETKFKGYYKTSVEAENPSIIIESFIIDVSMKQKSSASTTGQFRKIIMKMKQQVGNNDDPRIKQLFSILNGQFNMMEKKTGSEEPDDNDTDIEASAENKKSDGASDEPHIISDDPSELAD